MTWCGPGAAAVPSTIVVDGGGLTDDELLALAPWKLRVGAQIADAIEWALWKVIAFLRKPAPELVLPVQPSRWDRTVYAYRRVVPRLAPSRQIGVLLLMLIAFVAIPAAAQSTLDQIASVATQDSVGWLSTGLNLAFGIASTFLLTLGIIHFVKTYFSEGRSVPAAVKAMLGFAASVALPWVLLGSFSGAFCFGGCSGPGSVLSIAQDVGSAYGLAPVTPSGVLRNGVTIATEVLQTGANKVAQSIANAFPPLTGSWWDKLGQALSETGGFLAALVVIIILLLLLLVTWVAIVYVFFVLAVDLLLITIEAYFVIPLGAWTAGFQVGPLAGLAGNFWGAILGAVIRFIVVWALVALAQPIANLWPTQIAAANLNTIPNNIGALGTYVAGGFKLIVTICVDAFVLKTLFSKATQLAESVVSGRSALGGSGGQMVGGAANAAGGLAIGAATGGVGGAAMGGMTGARGAASAALISRMRGR